MKKSSVHYHSAGSAEAVVAHAIWSKKRGRAPSLPFLGIKNPREALRVAVQVISGQTVAQHAAILALKRLAPNWLPFPHLRGVYGVNMIRWLACHPRERVAAGGPEVVDQYTLGFLEVKYL